ncbi:hypothetical protein BDP81DRAFT_421593 [Colletotrichum phormii]|uniref:Uncharacterized protein n=1 Tax=Colletotrichum phormii TaxID=359342 RepID=A0AAI9ZWV8_9PEZI|nr:uncharacterized protein BDP81DRAFT_421593 [Colletotrichum phormii]KAK1639661.1 hypothetical protein BDP81DRAFT_421593 [Colletotrichum phormii]
MQGQKYPFRTRRICNAPSSNSFGTSLLTCQAVSCFLPSSCPALPSHHISTRHPFQFPSVIFWHFALFSVRYGTPHRRLKSRRVPSLPLHVQPTTRF